MSGDVDIVDSRSTFALRYADAVSAQAYPLPIDGHIPWQRTENGFICELALPVCAASSILVPSLTILDHDDYRFRFTLVAPHCSKATNHWTLHPVPNWPSETTNVAGEARVTTHIDCFHIHQQVDLPRLRVEVLTTRGDLNRYLLCCTARPITLAQVPAPTQTASLAAPTAQSQMLAPKEIARGICSPTSVYMILKSYGKPVDWLSFVHRCFEPHAKLYGSWPLALHGASHYGCLGAVEVFSGWPQVLACLDRGLPVVASIRFANGALARSPLKQTGGHLVVLHGVGKDEVLVLDPAASDNTSVARRYDTSQFADAWFRNRGAAYILLP